MSPFSVQYHSTEVGCVKISIANCCVFYHGNYLYVLRHCILDLWGMYKYNIIVHIVR